MTTRHVFVVLIMALLLSGLPMWGQGERGTITGTVTDTTGAIVPAATVTLRNVATNIQTRAETNNAGIYVFPALNPGAYDVTFEKQGFRSRKVSNIPLSTSLTATIDAVLEVGQVSEAIQVQAAAVQLEAQTSGLGKTVETRRVVELPLLGRDPRQLVALAPGVIPTRGQVGVGGDAIGQAGNARISGGLANQNAVLMDGGDSRGFTSGGQSYAFPIESVAEFKVETSTYSAEFGRSAGGVINVASRSGTNAYHGVVYDFIRSQALNANSWSNNRSRVGRAPFQFNQFGAAMGGRIKRDKTFFFANYEAVRQGSPNNFLATVPQSQWKTGDFRNTFDRNGNQVNIYDPLTTRVDAATGAVVRDMFPNNVIPTNRIHPISQQFLKFWPNSNRAGETPAQVNNYFKTGKNVNNIDSWFTRLDHQISEKHRIFGRFAGSQNESYPLGLVDAAFPATTTATRPTRNAGISLTSTFRPNLLGEFRISYTRQQNNSKPESEGFDLASVGFPKFVADAITYKQIPNIQIQQYSSGSGLAVATFNSTEISSLGGTSRDLLPQDTWHAQYHLTYIKGRHSLKFGVDLQRLKMAAFNSRNSGGQFVFDRTYTQGPNPAVTGLNSGNGFASFLLGIPINGSVDTTPYMMLVQRYSAFYIQDDWRVTSKLTLNLGFRYEYTSPYAEKYGQIGYFDPRAANSTVGLPGVFKWTKPGEYHSDPNYKTLGPRIGIAYALNSKTVIRTAGGIFNAANNGLNAAASDFGTGLFNNTPISLGAPNPIPFTPSVGGSWSNPFAAGIVQPVKGVTTFEGGNIRVDFKDHPLAYVGMWSFSIQRQITPNLVAEIGYSGSKTTHLFWNRMDNANDPLLLSQWGSKLNNVVSNPFFGKIPGIGAFPTIIQKQLLRPFPQYQQILAVRRPYADANYNSMVVRIEKAYSKGHTISLAYTMSKLIASTAESNTWLIGPSNALYNPNYNRHVEGNDTPHRMVLSHVWDLPFGYGQRFMNKGLAATVLGGWQFSGITVLQAGRPILISAPDNTGLLDFAYTNGRADRLKSGVIDNPTNLRWFDTTAFRPAAAFTVPTDSLSQPDLRTPWRTAVNWSVFKNTKFKEGRYNVQFRVEMFNVFNTPQFDVRGASTDVTNPLFGQITEGGGERNIQMGLRLVF